MQDKNFIDLEKASNEELLSLLYDYMNVYKVAHPNIGMGMMLCNILMLISLLLTRALGCVPENLKENKNDNANSNTH